MTDQLPAPLTPADCDLQDFKFMPLDVARLRDSDLASDETPEACWAAVLLWSASWHQIPAASIPDNDQWIAKAAGYAQRGKISPDWEKVRDGALRGWIRCADGRLYHPVVAEKAVDAWESKRDQRYRTEMARIKKHNDRHGTNIPRPTFDEWVSQGCPSGQRLFVPGDNTQVSQGQPTTVPKDKTDCPAIVPRETPSKGQGEGQGQGQIKKKTSLPPVGGGCQRFEDFWTAWPKNDRKQDKVKCAKKWRTDGLDAVADQILADIATKKLTRKWQEDGGKYIEAPLVYLNGRRWEDGVEAEETAAAGFV